MQALVTDTCRGHIHPVDSEGIHRLRYQTFLQRLNWDIPSANEQERDIYDDLHPVFVIVREQGQVIGCCRLLPTVGPYMLKNTFPALLASHPAPVALEIWEISRFAVTQKARAGTAFTTIPLALIRETTRFALANGIKEYVFVTTVGFERLLVRMGGHIERFGPPQQIGIEKSVALRVFMDEQTINAALRPSAKKGAEPSSTVSTQATKIG